MAVYQIFVKLLDGQTQCLQISTPFISGETLKRRLLAKTRIPVPFQRLVTGSRIVSDETLLSTSDDGFFPSCALLLRLPGGKGGFGSLLRGAATKAGQKKTNNFDACRDMSGRRLRHVNAEKKLEEWKAEAEDRRLKKLAEQFLKKKSKEAKKNSSVGVDKYLEKYREDSAKCMEEVEESVRNSFGVYKDLKRKMGPVSDRSSKKLKMWLGKTQMDESCSEDDDEFEEKSVVLDDGTSLEKNNIIEGSSSMSAGSGSSSDLESPCGDSEKSNLEQVNQSMLDDGSSDVSTLKNFVKLDERTEQMIKQSCQIEEQNNVLSEVDAMIPEAAFGSTCIPKAVVPEGDVAKQEFFCSSEPNLDNEAIVQSTTNSSFEEPLNFDHYKSAEELTVLGMERLKLELQARGLKCGGTLLERASRLFLLKTTPLEKLPKKLLSKPSN